MKRVTMTIIGHRTKSRHQGLAVMLPLGALNRDRNGVGDVRFAASASDTVMGFVGKFISTTDLLNPFAAQIFEFGFEEGEAGRRRLAGWRGGARGCNVRHASNVSFCA